LHSFLPLAVRMCRHTYCQISASPLAAASDMQREQTPQLQVQINSACSGEVLLQSVTVAETWTVRRLKLAIARQVCAEAADQSLLFAGKLLADNEALSTLLPQAGGMPVILMLLRSQPKATTQLSAGASAARRQLIVTSNGEPVSCVRWRIEAQNLKRNDMTLTSPMFELSFGDGLEKVPFKLSLLASDGRSFARSRGQGCIQLKCIDGLPKAAACAGILAKVSSGSEAIVAAAEATVDHGHCFATNAALRLPRGESIDFGAFVDGPRSIVEIAVEIIHSRKAEAETL